MNREETLAIMSVLKAAYPAYYRDMSRMDAEAVVGLWSEMFSNDSPQEVAVAVKAFICSDKKGFPPNIATIKDYIYKLRHKDEMTEIEAWSCVRQALCNSIYNSAKEFEKLPPVVQRLVGSHNQLREWALMDSDTVNSVVASNFQRSYKARAASEREFLALPADVQRKMEMLSSGMSLDRKLLEG